MSRGRTQAWWVECSTCGYDSKEAGFLDKVKDSCICPICAEDCGHDNYLLYTPATEDQIAGIKEVK